MQKSIYMMISLSRRKIHKAAGEPRRSARNLRRTGVPVSAQCSLVSFSAPCLIIILHRYLYKKNIA